MIKGSLLHKFLLKFSSFLGEKNEAKSEKLESRIQHQVIKHDTNSARNKLHKKKKQWIHVGKLKTCWCCHVVDFSHEFLQLLSWINYYSLSQCPRIFNYSSVFLAYLATFCASSFFFEEEKISEHRLTFMPLFYLYSILLVSG